VYVAVGALVVIGLLVWTKVCDQNPRSWEAIAVVITAVTLGAGGLLLVTFRYRLRIDARGLWRRRLVRWDLWPWEAFEGGRIKHGKYGDQLTNPDKGWYWRTISASVLGETDRAVFEAAVKHFRVPPPPPDLPGVVTLKLGMRTRLELSADGVRWAARPQDDGEFWPWPEVVKAEITRSTHDRPDFVTLNLHLPGSADPVQFMKRQGNQNWSGPDAEVIALFLRRHLPDDRFEVTALRGAPANLAEANRRLSQLDLQEQKLRTAFRAICWTVVVGVLVLTTALSDIWKRPNLLNWGPQDWAAVCVGLLLAAPYLAVVHFRRRDLRPQREELLLWRANNPQAG
jgi:hypothetical protein